MFYKLGGPDGHTPIPITRDEFPGALADAMGRQVAHALIGGVRVSTVFHVIDHEFMPDRPPILFETMVFGGKLNHEQRRYRTWSEAIIGHRRMVRRVLVSERRNDEASLRREGSE